MRGFIKLSVCFLFLFTTAFASLRLEEVKDTETAKAIYPLYSQLNPWIQEDEFLRNLEKARTQDYHLYQAFDLSGYLIGLIGYQFIQQLYAGRYMQIDSLVVDKTQQRKGYGKEIMRFTFRQFVQDAETNHCKDVRWDTGLEREGAQKFYESGLGVAPTGKLYSLTLQKAKDLGFII